MRRLLAGVAVLTVALVALAGPAAAHAQLVGTSPTAGAVLTASPKVASVRFNETVQAKADGLQLHDARGQRVGTDGLRRFDDGRTLALPVSGLRDGGYVLTWRVVSADGHPISGGVTWRIGASSTAVDQGLFQQLLNAEGGNSSVHVAAAVVRTVVFLSLLLLVGGLLFLAAAWPEGAGDVVLRPTLRAAAAVGALATVAGMGIQGADVDGLGLAHALGPSAALGTLDTSFGQAAVARLVLLGVLALLAGRATSTVVRTTGWRVATSVAAAATLLTLSLSGHARTGRWLALSVPLDLVHLVAAAAWIGGLGVLALVVLPRHPDESAAVAARFSRLAALAVAAVVTTGLVQSYRQLGHLEALRTTGYGRLLVVKTVLVAVVVVFGALSRSLVRAQEEARIGVRRPVPVGAGADGEVDFEDEDEAPDPLELHRALRRSVGTEALIAVLVLAVTSVLVASDPARTIESQGFSAAKVVQGTVVEAVAAPARTGPVDLHIYASDPTIGLRTTLTATATLSLPEKGIRSVQVPLQPAGHGHWSAYNVDIPIKGTWRLDVVVVVGDFEERRAQFSVPID